MPLNVVIVTRLFFTNTPQRNTTTVLVEMDYRENNNILIFSLSLINF